MLEVEVIQLKPTLWEWRVYNGDTPVKAGFAGSRETAQIDGNSALFRLHRCLDYRPAVPARPEPPLPCEPGQPVR